jgi:hypothetical protein
MRNGHTILSEKPKVKIPLVIPNRTWDNIKMDLLKKLGLDSACTESIQWWNTVNAVRKFCVR